jgi:predicted nucleotidyltransferase
MNFTANVFVAAEEELSRPAARGDFAYHGRRMGVDETLLNEVVRRVLTVAQPERIILFGFAVTGQMTGDSDIDLLVVEPEPASTRDRSVKIRRALGDVPYPVDVIVISSERFEETKNIIGGIAYPANKHGRVLYEAA